MCKNSINSKLRGSNCGKMADFAFGSAQTWFHVKSEWYKNYEISTLWGK